MKRTSHYEDPLAHSVVIAQAILESVALNNYKRKKTFF